MPDFVKKLIAKKGRENVKMPYLVKKMLEKKYGKKYDQLLLIENNLEGLI